MFHSRLKSHLSIYLLSLERKPDQTEILHPSSPSLSNVGFLFRCSTDVTATSDGPPTLVCQQIQHRSHSLLSAVPSPDLLSANHDKSAAAATWLLLATDFTSLRAIISSQFVGPYSLVIAKLKDFSIPAGFFYISAPPAAFILRLFAMVILASPKRRSSEGLAAANQWYPQLTPPLIDGTQTLPCESRCHRCPRISWASEIQPLRIDTPMQFMGLETLNYCPVKSTPYQSRASRLSLFRSPA